MCDKLVFDLAQEVEGSPSVFVRKDWINILDNQTQNYTSNQSVVDTSQLSNSNKYMSYRESYFIIPMVASMVTVGAPVYNANANAGVPAFTPEGPNQLGAVNTKLDSVMGLKNWFGNIIHSFTLDYNGSTIIQQTPFVNMWNSFKLMTSLSYGDVITQGCTIGFYPDSAESLEFYQFDRVIAGVAANSLATPVAPVGAAENVYIYNGNGTSNNSDALEIDCGLNALQSFRTGKGNLGFIERQKWIAFDSEGNAGVNLTANSNPYPITYGELLGGVGQAGQLGGNTACNQLWKSYISKKKNYAAGVTCGIIQYNITATVYLKHIHSFFNMCPLLKGVFMKMTMNLNNSASTVVVGANVLAPVAGAQNNNISTAYSFCNSTQSALGGVNPLMLSSIVNYNGANPLVPTALGAPAIIGAAANSIGEQVYRLSLSVGKQCLDQVTLSQVGFTGNQATNSCQSIYLYIPAYTFNPPFEQAYISSPVKSIKYTDIYQYQVLGVGANNGQFNNLLTNGIANIKSVLILPFYSSSGDTQIPQPAGVVTAINTGTNTGTTFGTPVWQSPFDPAGCGPTSPLCHFTNFNVQVSGQNAIYNLQLRGFEQFNNQLYGQNAVNGGLTDGITSSLVDRQQFDLEYCYYYVNVERMLPVEQSVPKSVQILGTNLSGKKVDLLCFIEYGTEVSIDVLTGSRV